MWVLWTSIGLVIVGVVCWGVWHEYREWQEFYRKEREYDAEIDRLIVRTEALIRSLRERRGHE